MTDRSMGALLRDFGRRITSLERRLARSPSVSADRLAFTGEVKMMAAVAVPDGWLLCRGQSLLRADYPALFAAIGVTYGSVDGTHFNVPSPGRVPVGVDPTQTEFNALGKTGGAKTHTLNASQMSIEAWQDVSKVNPGAPGWITPQSSGGRWFSNGAVEGILSGQPHNNLQPYIAFNFIIKT